VAAADLLSYYLLHEEKGNSSSISAEFMKRRRWQIP
jgi:hypothetical protein